MGTIVAFTGKAGSGKSTILTNTACYLAKNSKLNVGCLSCDLRYPSLPGLFNGIEIPPERSIGKLFSDLDPAKKFVEYPGCEGVFVSATAITDNALEYEPPGDRETIIKFLQRLNNSFDVLLVEAEDVQLNFFSMRAVKQCDIRFNVVTPSMQSMAWERATSNLYKELPGKILQILNADSENFPVEEMKKVIGPISVQLPNIEQMHVCAEHGSPFYLESMQLRAGRRYVKGIEKIGTLIKNGGELE